MPFLRHSALGLLSHDIMAARNVFGSNRRLLWAMCVPANDIEEAKPFRPITVADV